MLNGVFYVILMILLGFILMVCKVLPEESRPHLSSFLMSLCFPAMILKSFATVDPDELLSKGLSILIVTVVFSLLPAAILLLKKNKGSLHSLYSFICGIGNVSFVCIPLLRLFLTDAEMVVVYLHVSIQDLLIWALFHPAFAGSRKSGNWRSLLTEPCLLAVFAGLVLCFTGIPIPDIFSMPINALDACVSPLALVFLGMTIGRYRSCVFKSGTRPLLYTLFKVIAYPLMIFLLLLPFLSRETAVLLAILFGSPAPVASVVWMQKYTDDPTPAITCLIPSTILYYLLYTPLLLFLCKQGIFGS